MDPAQREPAIDVRDLVVAYDEWPALDGLSLTVRAQTEGGRGARRAIDVRQCAVAHNKM